MPRHQNQVNLDPNTKTEHFSTPKLKPCQFRSLNWNQFNFDPPQWNPVNLDQPHKNEVELDAHTKPSDIRPAH